MRVADLQGQTRHGDGKLAEVSPEASAPFDIRLA
jgi:hypothetical protein